MASMQSRIRTISESVQKRAELSRLYRRLIRREAGLSRETERLGEAFYEGGAEGANAQREIVSALRRDAEGLRARIDQLEGIARCPACAKAASPSDRYCRACGTCLSERRGGSGVEIVWPETENSKP